MHGVGGDFGLSDYLEKEERYVLIWQIFNDCLLYKARGDMAVAKTAAVLGFPAPLHLSGSCRKRGPGQ